VLPPGLPPDVSDLLICHAESNEMGTDDFVLTIANHCKSICEHHDEPPEESCAFTHGDDFAEHSPGVSDPFQTRGTKIAGPP
jgi:hypothetical protein